MNEELLWQADKGDGTYRNPILYADYSDPDVIRVEDTYYMTASSFNYTPGLPILISKDLVNWSLVNYAVKNINYDTYGIPAHGKGIWAPAIRYYHNKLWIYYGMPDEGIFMVNTKNPLGEWSEPVCVLEGKGFIDPCPFWDEGGKAYVIHGYANSRIGFKSILGIFPMSEDGTRATGEDRFIFDGRKTQPTIEGPKVYKKGGYYYIFAPAGGVRTGWQTVLRATSIYGPYEEKIVMAQGSTKINGPHQGGLVDTKHGEEWFLHFQDRGAYGRIVHLQPVKWSNGWPIIGENPDKNGIGEPVLTYKKPKVTVCRKPLLSYKKSDGSRYGEPVLTHERSGETDGKKPVFTHKRSDGTGCEESTLTYKKPDMDMKDNPTYLRASDDFTNETLSLQWQWLGNHEKAFYSLRQRKGFLRLYSQNPSRDDTVTLWRTPNILTQKIVCPSFQATVRIELQGLKDEEQTGMVLLGGQYAYIAVRRQEKHLMVVYVESQGEEEIRQERVLMKERISDKVQKVEMKLVVTNQEESPVARFSYRINEDMIEDANQSINEDISKGANQDASTYANEDISEDVNQSMCKDANQNTNEDASKDGNEGRDNSINEDAYRETGYEFSPSKHTWVGAKIGLFSLPLYKKESCGYGDIDFIKVESMKDEYSIAEIKK